MTALIPKTVRIKNQIFHIYDDATIQCSGADCRICNSALDVSFDDWKMSIPFPIPPKGKRYKRKEVQKNRGKSIEEICYTCKKTPCFVCRRTKCKQWMKRPETRGQEKGCAYWENGRCTDFFCDKRLIKEDWHALLEE